jgi:putative endonuclease
LSKLGRFDRILKIRFITKDKKGRIVQLVTRPNVPFGTGGERFMYIVYLLLDAKGKLYKGMTNYLERRVSEHRSGHTRTTSRMRNLKVVYKKSYQGFEEARKRELYFKTAAGRRFFKKVLSK